MYTLSLEFFSFFIEFLMCLERNTSLSWIIKWAFYVLILYIMHRETIWSCLLAFLPRLNLPVLRKRSQFKFHSWPLHVFAILSRRLIDTCSKDGSEVARRGRLFLVPGLLRKEMKCIWTWKSTWRRWNMAQLGHFLPSTHKALNLVSSAT